MFAVILNSVPATTDEEEGELYGARLLFKLLSNMSAPKTI